MSVSKFTGLAVMATAGLLLLTGCAAPAETNGDALVPTDPAAAALLPEEFKDGISVASEIEYPPMEMFDANDNPTGFDYDLSVEIGKKLGVVLSFENQNWDGIIPSLQSGDHDIIMSGMNDIPERREVLDFVDYFAAGFAVLVAEGNPEGINSFADLCGKIVGVQTSTAQIELLNQVNPSCPEPIEILEFPSDSDVQNAIRSGGVVAGVHDGHVAVYNSQVAGQGGYFDVVEPKDAPEGYESLLIGIGVLKENSGLTAAIQAAVQSLIDDGTYAKLLAKWNLSAYGVSEATINGTK